MTVRTYRVIWKAPVTGAPQATVVQADQVVRESDQPMRLRLLIQGEVALEILEEDDEGNVD